MEDDPNEFWKQAEGAFLILRTGYSPDRHIHLEQVYQHFKARLMAELLVDVHDSPVFALLCDRASVTPKEPA